MKIVLAATTVATVMQVGGGALSGLEGRGGPGAAAARGVDRGGEQERGFITPCPPPPPRHLALVVAVAVTVARLVAAVVVVAVAVMTMAVASGSGSGSGRVGQWR